MTPGSGASKSINIDATARAGANSVLIPEFVVTSVLGKAANARMDDKRRRADTAIPAATLHVGVKRITVTMVIPAWRALGSAICRTNVIQPVTIGITLERNPGQAILRSRTATMFPCRIRVDSVHGSTVVPILLQEQRQ